MKMAGGLVNLCCTVNCFFMVAVKSSVGNYNIKTFIEIEYGGYGLELDM